MYARFYKENGVRFITHLKNPRLRDYNQLVLPRESLIHWVDYEGKYEVGPPQDEPFLVRNEHRLYVEAVSEYPKTGVKEGWIVARSNTKGYVLKYDSENPNIRRMSKLVGEYVSNEVMPMYAYGLLNTTYRYKRYIDTELNRWMNYHYTVFNKALEVSKLSDRQQFIELEAPARFPSFQNLKKGESGITKANIRYLGSSDHWIVVVLWNLIAGNGNDFIFKDYTHADFKKINIIWRSGSKYMLTNMGVLLGFAYGEQAAVTPARLQKLLIRSFIDVNLLAKDTAETEQVIDEELDAFTGTSDGENEGEQVNDDDELVIEDDDEDNGDDSDDATTLLSPFKTDNITTRQVKDTAVADNFTTPDKIVLDDDDGAEEEDDFLNTLDAVADDTDVDSTGYKPYVSKEVSGVSVIEDEGGKLVKAGVMSVGSYERLIKLSKASSDLPDPLNPHKTIAESSLVTKQDTTIEEQTSLKVDSNDIIDESMNYSSLNKYTKQYIENVHHKDVLNAVMGIQKGGVIIKDYQIERIESVNDKYNIHKVQIETIKGHVSTLSFKIPVIESDGTFKSAGSRRYIRKQRGDVPIRKVNFDSVALTSYYSKMFVNRSDRKQFNYEGYVHNHIVSSSIDKTNGISEVKFGEVFDNTLALPRVYTILAKKFISFDCKGNTFKLNVNKLDENFPNRIKRKNALPVAVKAGTDEVSLYLTKDVNPILLDAKGESIGQTLENYLGLDMSVAPVEYAEVNIFGKNIPLVLILAHHLGFGNLLKSLKLSPRREARNKRLSLEDGEYAIRFKDEVLIFNRKHNKNANLIINGLLRFKNSINTMSVYDLDNKSIYNDLFEEVKAPLKLLKESRDMFNLWIDPITEGILKDMGEPTDLVLLFIRASELLVTDEHPDGMDIAYMRDKGYERIAGMVYGELVKATREYNTRSIYNNNKLTINPESIWYSIITDQTVSLVEESNPIHNLKEGETVIYSGQGGRSGTTMTAGSRKYHKSNLGVISEATVDSGDVGTIIYNVADPNYTSVYGISKRVEDIDKVGGAKILSPSALLAPGGEHDD